MISALTSAMLLSGAWQLEDRPLVERFREVCVETRMERTLFERAVADRGFEPLLRVVRPGQVLPNEWSVGVDDNGVQMVMDGKPGSNDATDCGVLMRSPKGDWRGDIEGLARELNMQSIPHAPSPEQRAARVGDAKSWTSGDSTALSLHYEVYNETVVVRFGRPSASSQ